jgi:hypothetical protein
MDGFARCDVTSRVFGPQNVEVIMSMAKAMH